MNHIVLVAAILAIQGGSQHQKTHRPPAKATVVSDAKTKIEAQRRKLAVIRVQSFADRVGSFQDIEAKADALARLAGMLWKDDESYARQLFTKALDASATSAATGSANEKLTPRDLAKIHRQVITHISRRDPAWAKRLIDEAIADPAGGSASFDKGRTSIDVALDLVKDQPKEAANFAERSLRSGVQFAMISFLREMRLKDEASANTMFLKTLNQLVATPVVDVNELLQLGTYVFTSPRVINPADYTSALQMLVGSVPLYDLTADRPGISPPVVKAYLAAAAQILARPVSDARQQKSYYAAGRMLLPKYQQFAPELAPNINAALSALTSSVPQEMTNQSLYTNLANYTPKDEDESLEEIEKLPGGERRDVRYLSLSANSLREGEFERARLAASKISDEDAKSRLMTIIDFSDAARLLGNDKVELQAVEEAAKKLSQGVERAVLWFGIARAHAQTNNKQSAVEAIDEALKTARKVDDPRRSYLLLYAAGQLARLGEESSKLALMEAVQEFNKQDSEVIAKVDWWQKVEIGPLTHRFPLKVAGVEFNFNDALPPLVAADPDGTEGAIALLTHEKQVAQALLAQAAVTLK